MKSMINDYFRQSPKELKNVSVSNEAPSGKAHEKGTKAESIIPEDAGAIMNGNMKAIAKRTDCTLLKEKSKLSSRAGSSGAKNSSKKKSSSTRRQVRTEEAHNEENFMPNSDDIVKSPVQGFALKIRIRSKEQSEEDNLIQEFSSPNQDTSVDEEVQGMKSPQGTMLKYLITQKSPSVSEKDDSPAKKSEFIRDISDFLLSPKGQDAGSSAKNTKILKPSPSEMIIDYKSEEENRDFIKEQVTSNSSKSCRKSKKKSLSVSQRNNVRVKAPDQNLLASKTQHQKEKSTPNLKSKSAKKSLSLGKIERTAKRQALLKDPTKMKLSSKMVVSESKTGLEVADSINNALKDILSKSTNDMLSADMSPLTNTPPKKRKREEGDGCEVEPLILPSDASHKDYPVKSKRRLVKTNQSGRDSDDNLSSKLGTANLAQSLSKTLNENDDVVKETIDNSVKVQESTRNNLMKYFSKVSREEILAKSEKVEMKVKVLIHSPPTTPSKKTKRRSINSLPGGAACVQNTKKGNLKNKLKENMNAIEIVDSEEAIGNNKNSLDVPTEQTKKKKASPASAALKVKSSKIISSPSKSSALVKNLDSSELKANGSAKSGKTDSLKRAVKGEIKSSLTITNKVPQIADEENLALPLTSPENESHSDTISAPSKEHSSWKLRVCLAPQQMPSTQGTMLEEDSDCDEIFLSRRDKKRRLETQRNSFKSKSKGTCEEVIEKSISPDIVFEKKIEVKVAPLFTRKADSQARQLFLQSGVPEKVKRALDTQQSLDEPEVESFPKQSHIQQKDEKEWTWNLPEVEVPLKADCVEVVPKILDTFSLSSFTGCGSMKEELDHINATCCRGPMMRPVFDLPIGIVKPILRLIKKESPDFKVVSTFKALRSKFREEQFYKAAALSALVELQRPKRRSSIKLKSNNTKNTESVTTYRAQSWTEKYKPSSSTEIIGNCESVRQLKRWLESWRKASEDASKINREDLKRKKRKNGFIDDDDFVISDDSSEGGHNSLPVGVALLYGSNGSGKTSTVYALAKDLGYNVLEVNASEKRNGKLVLSKLSEATQSHQVQQSTSVEQGFAALFGNSPKNRKKPPKEIQRMDSEEEKTIKMSLILFEDVDVVFEEEDEGFLSAISNLVSTSKRPVILTTTDLESCSVKRFMNNASLMLHFSCPSNLISSWLQIVSIVEGIYATSNTIRNLVSLCKGDFRRALLQLQLWVLSGGNNLPLPPSAYPQYSRKSKKGLKNDDDEISDFDDDSEDSIPTIPANPDCVASMLGINNSGDCIASENTQKKSFVKVPYPMDIGLFWWNIPPLLSLKQLEHTQLPVAKDNPEHTSGSKRMLDDSFIASFCTDDGNISDSATNEGFLGSSEAGKTESVALSLSSNSANCKSSCSLEEMMAMSYLMNSLSCIDIISVSSGLSNSPNTEPVLRFSQPTLKDSLTLVVEEREGPNFVYNSIANEVCHWLAEQALNKTKLSVQCDSPNNYLAYNHCLPNEEEYRWRNAHAETECAILDAVPLCMHLEHGALATDYFPCLRTICRLEKNRSIINTKRQNRFYHYLKSLGVHLTDSKLELLCCTMSNL